MDYKKYYKDDVVAKYSLEGYNIPIGVSSFESSKFLPKDFSSSMPTIEEIENDFLDTKITSDKKQRKLLPKDFFFFLPTIEEIENELKSN